MDGFLYCLSNPSMPGLVKIGVTTKTVEERVKQLSSTGVPQPFNIELQKWVNDPFKREKELHKLLSEYRVNDKREFFKIDIEDVRKCFDSIDEAFSGTHYDDVMSKWLRIRKFLEHVGDSGLLWSKSEPILECFQYIDFREKDYKEILKNYDIKKAISKMRYTDINLSPKEMNFLEKRWYDIMVYTFAYKNIDLDLNSQIRRERVYDIITDSPLHSLTSLEYAFSQMLHFRLFPTAESKKRLFQTYRACLLYGKLESLSYDGIQNGDLHNKCVLDIEYNYIDRELTWYRVDEIIKFKIVCEVLESEEVRFLRCDYPDLVRFIAELKSLY